MKEQIETVVPRRKIVAGDRDEARKTATGHSCGPLGVMQRDESRQENDTDKILKRVQKNR